MTDYEALLATILENPADDTVRLVFADQLRESDDSDEQARGRFLWGGVTATRFVVTRSPIDPTHHLALVELATIAGQGHPAQWLSKLGIGPSPLSQGDWTWGMAQERVRIFIGGCSGLFTRGMLSELSVTLGEWYALSKKVLLLWPLERIEITDVPGLYFVIRKVSDGWELVGGID